MTDSRFATGCNGYFPPLPAAVDGVAHCTVPLTDRSKSDWQFLFEEISDIPCAFDEDQDYDFGKIDGGKWQSVTVPSELCMQGFDIKNNAEYYYKRTVNIPSDYHGKRIFLRFEGVYSNARVWIDGKFCASHIGGLTPWDADITDLAQSNEITLTVGVADLEGSAISPWNPRGEYQSNSAWVSYYAHHNIGGIIRDITMFCLPSRAILQTHIGTVITEGGARAQVEASFAEECVGLRLKASITDAGTVKAEKTIDIDGESVKFSLDVPSAKLWDAEHPNLYELRTELHGDNGVLQANTVKFGFREITYGGQNGTEKNRIYVNGKEIKLRGVCRHDVSRLYGRSLTKEDIYHEIKTYKEHNINHIRTSHYPASDYMLEVCDELGMYVEQENAACFKGDNGFEIYNPPVDFLRSFAEMIEFSRNHPSVIIWSLANESGFEKSSGFRDCYNYAKRTDKTRPVIFSYPRTVKSNPLPYDIFSKHYEKVTANLGRSDMPILHDEFAHVPCYNLEDLATDNGCRVFWGESIMRGWDSIFDTPGALGCDIWGAIDDVFYLPSKSMEKHQNHLKGECAGYGEWGCVFDAFKRLKPEAYLTKKAYTPIKIKGTRICAGEIIFDIQNRFDHTDLSEVTVEIRDKSSNLLYGGKIRESIPAHSCGTVTLPPVDRTDDVTVSFIHSGYVAESTVICGSDSGIKDRLSPLSCEGFTLESGDAAAAHIESMYLKIGRDGKAKVKRAAVKKAGKHKYSASFGFGKSFLLSVRECGGELQFKVKPRGPISALCNIGELGVEIKPASSIESVEWSRKALYDNYPDGHIARESGTATKAGVAHDYPDTDLSGTPWELDTAAFAYYENGSSCNSLASNDFKTKRFNIMRYTATAADGSALTVRTDCEHINAYANPFLGTLQIGKGTYMPSIAWGNYYGKRFRLSGRHPFNFTVSFKQKSK